jgi:hypothetical protein
VSVPSNAVLTRARVARRVVALLLVVAGVLACVMSVLNVTGGVLGDLRFAATLGFLILGPGWAPAAHVWLLTIGTGVAATLLAGQIMVSSGYWQPATALYVLTAVSIPFLLRHAVVAQ